MTRVDYEYEFAYPYSPNGHRFPILLVALENGETGVETHAYLDSGAEYSIFQQDLGAVLGLDLLAEPTRTYITATGDQLVARVRVVTVRHPDLGAFRLELGFARVSRNLLGRDFFNYMQIGFRERYLTFYVTARS